ncbi:MAG: ABC-F family ATP-binding cassette domain-containing protein [Chloroflexi bacterium]|nr:ABC-F family ATP-binding cassette domain-containing protein [Chloroflexota bacterium]MBP7041153.1 ABC-F family ATP-binding cassette domain-containing protein [Chloroflexota bacterium]
MLTAHGLNKQYGLAPVLKNITFSVNGGERVGLIGPNGSGKTTLLRLLTGQEKPDSGYVALNPGALRVGHLAQGFEPDPAQTVAEVLHTAVGDPATLEDELAQLALALAENPEREELQEAYDDVLMRLNRSDNGRIPAILAAFDLDLLPQTQLVGTLSGGQKTRLALALVLLGDPQLLLLDEPTNHLDIAMLEWLEAWLANFPGGALIVSHDRAFLDQTANRILDLDPITQTIREYAGNYTDYLEQYLNEQEKKWSAYKDQVYEIRRLKQDIARQRESAMAIHRATTARQPGVRMFAKKAMKRAKSREKKLERYENSDERVEKPARSWQIKLDFEEPAHLGRDVLALEGLNVGYAGFAPLLTDLNQLLQAGQRVVVTGPNGAGKSTLLRTIAGEIRPLSGHLRLGGSVKLGYMSQEQEGLTPGLTALETIQRAAPLNETDARSYLHYFLFSGDDPLRPIEQLSFGERARLALARLVAEGCNFLLLDEPINHLDIPSRTRFEQALGQFEGTVLAVVHDRYFIERFAEEVWVVEDGRLTTMLL